MIGQAAVSTTIALISVFEQRAFELFEIGDLRSNIPDVVENHCLDITTGVVAFDQSKEGRESPG